MQPLSLGEVVSHVLLIGSLLISAGVALVLKPKVGFLAAWVFITLAPTSSVVPIPTEVGAERRMYLAFDSAHRARRCRCLMPLGSSCAFVGRIAAGDVRRRALVGAVQRRCW